MVDQTQDEPVVLDEAELDLLANLGIDTSTGLQLKSFTRQKIEGLYKRFLDDGNREPEIRGIRSVYKGKWDAVVKFKQQQTANDIHVFECDSFNESANVALVKCTDRYDILRIMETAGLNYDVSTEDVIRFLEKWEVKIPFFWICLCDRDVLVIELDVTNSHLAQMVKEAVGICPDMTGGDDSHEAFEKLLATVRESGDLYFWWD